LVTRSAAVCAGMRGWRRHYIRSRLLLSLRARNSKRIPASARASDVHHRRRRPHRRRARRSHQGAAVDVIPRDFRVADTRRARVILIEAGGAVLLGVPHGFLGTRADAAAGLGVEVGSAAGHHRCSRTGGGRRRTAAQPQRHLDSGCARRAAHCHAPVAARNRRAVRVSPDCRCGAPRDVRYRRRCLSRRCRERPAGAGVSQGRAADGALRRARDRRGAARGAQRARRRIPLPRQGFHGTVAKSRAVEIGRLHFGGWLGVARWMALHITVYRLSQPAGVLSSWIYSYVFFRRLAV